MDFYPVIKGIGILVIIGQVIGVLTLLGLIITAHMDQKWKTWIAEHSTLFAFIVALTAMCCSLFFSDIALYEPCKLCWFQRIFIFPQVFLLGLALYRKEHDAISSYSLLLASIGILISGYHFGLQMSDAPASGFLPCSTVGQAPSCGDRYVFLFGYLTIPLMAFTTQALIIILMLMRKAFAPHETVVRLWQRIIFWKR